MELVKGYKFFSPDECEQMQAYCDKKERKLESVTEKQADKKTIAMFVRIEIIKLPVREENGSQWSNVYHNNQLSFSASSSPNDTLPLFLTPYRQLLRSRFPTVCFLSVAPVD